MTELDATAKRFLEISTEILKSYSYIDNQCVSVCALISSELEKDGIAHSIALGSLSCNGIKAFQYKKAFPKKPKTGVVWDGHAWIDFDGEVVGEATLMRSARRFPETSNIKTHLKRLNLLNKGAFVLPRAELRQLGLKYTKRKELPISMVTPLIEGLKHINDI